MLGILFIGFLVLEGFDYGVEMLLPFLGKSNSERQAIINTLAPVWEGNEVWLIAAGAVLFAGFPHVYATLFSGLYLALLLMLTSLILRGVAFEFRNKDISKKWRSFWDWTIFFGGAIPAFIWGVAVVNLLHGLPIDGDMEYVGDFWDLISLYTVTGGLVFVVTFLLHGTAYLALKLDERFSPSIRKTGIIIGKYAIFTGAFFAILSFLYTDAASNLIASGLLLAALWLLVYCRHFMKKHSYVKSFLFSTLSIVSINSAIFMALFPRIIVSQLDPSWSLDIYNSASNLLTLRVMTITMIFVLPTVILFEVWKFYIFRGRVSTGETNLEYRELWIQLYQKINELIECASLISVKVEKIKNRLKDTEYQLKEYKTLIHRGHQLVNAIESVINSLRKWKSGL